MKVAYARVSTNDQDVALQIAALRNAGCEKFFEDKASGSFKDRPGLLEALAFMQEGDTLCVWKLDRLGRTVKHLIEISELLTSRKIHLQSITDGIDTSTPMGRFFFHIMAALAEVERELIVERTKAGLKTARSKGIKLGRKFSLTPQNVETVKKLLQAGESIHEIAKKFSVSVASVYRYFPGGMQKYRNITG